MTCADAPSYSRALRMSSKEKRLEQNRQEAEHEAQWQSVNKVTKACEAVSVVATVRWPAPVHVVQAVTRRQRMSGFRCECSPSRIPPLHCTSLPSHTHTNTRARTHTHAHTRAHTHTHSHSHFHPSRAGWRCSTGSNWGSHRKPCDGSSWGGVSCPGCEQ